MSISFESNPLTSGFGEMPQPKVDTPDHYQLLHESYEGPAVADIALDHEPHQPLPRLEAVAPILGKTAFLQ